MAIEPVMVAITDSFESAVEPPVADGIERPAIANVPHTDAIDEPAPNAMCLSALHLACVHQQFEQLAEDARRLSGSQDIDFHPVVSLKVGSETFYFMKMPDGVVVQVVPISSGGYAALIRRANILHMENILVPILPLRRLFLTTLTVWKHRAARIGMTIPITVPTNANYVDQLIMSRTTAQMLPMSKGNVWRNRVSRLSIWFHK